MSTIDGEMKMNILLLVGYWHVCAYENSPAERSREDNDRILVVHSIHHWDNEVRTPLHNQSIIFVMKIVHKVH